MSGDIRVACVQMRTTRDVDENIKDATALIREAHDGGAQFVVTPEMTSLLELGRTDEAARGLMDRRPRVFESTHGPARGSS